MLQFHDLENLDQIARKEKVEFGGYLKDRSLYFTLVWEYKSLKTFYLAMR